MVRKLRIAASAFFTVLTVAALRAVGSELLVGESDAMRDFKDEGLVVMTVGGEIMAAIMDTSAPIESSFYTGKLESGEAEQYRQPRWRFSPPEEIKTPIWFVVAMCGLVAAIPWLRWRFSLSTLLIATTLVAVVLGLGVWLAS